MSSFVWFLTALFCGKLQKLLTFLVSKKTFSFIVFFFLGFPQQNKCLSFSELISMKLCSPPTSTSPCPLNTSCPELYKPHFSSQHQRLPRQEKSRSQRGPTEKYFLLLSLSSCHPLRLSWKCCFVCFLNIKVRPAWLLMLLAHNLCINQQLSKT